MKEDCIIPFHSIFIEIYFLFDLFMIYFFFFFREGEKKFLEATYTHVYDRKVARDFIMQA